MIRFPSILPALQSTRDSQRLDLYHALAGEPLSAGGLWWGTINQEGAAIAAGYRDRPAELGPQGMTWRDHALRFLAKQRDEFCGAEQFSSYDSFHAGAVAAIALTAAWRDAREVLDAALAWLRTFVALGELLSGPGGIARGTGHRNGGVEGDHGQRGGARGGEDPRRDAIRALLMRREPATIKRNADDWFEVLVVEAVVKASAIPKLEAEDRYLPRLRSPMVVRRYRDGHHASCERLVGNWGGPVWEVDWRYSDDSVRSVSWRDVTPRWKGGPRPHGWNLKRADPPRALSLRDLGPLLRRVELGPHAPRIGGDSEIPPAPGGETIPPDGPEPTKPPKPRPGVPSVEDYRLPPRGEHAVLPDGGVVRVLGTGRWEPVRLGRG